MKMKLLKIVRDINPLNPRELYEPLGTMTCWHRRYTIGDRHSFKNPQEFEAVMGKEIAVRLPLYFYEHGAITISTKPFADPWDSGFLGWIYVTKPRLREVFGVKRLTQKIIEEAENVLMDEVAEYDAYLQGEVFGFELYEIDNDKVVYLDSCYGFYGSNMAENGMLEQVPQEFRKILGKIKEARAGTVITEDGQVIEDRLESYLLEKGLIQPELFTTVNALNSLLAV